jgi:hypothetical protein
MKNADVDVGCRMQDEDAYADAESESQCIMQNADVCSNGNAE